MPPTTLSTLSPKPWALGWLIDTEYFVELARYLDLYDGPRDNWVELMGAGIDYVLAATSWPNFMECTIDGQTEFVFAVYVDYKRRPLPPHVLPRSQLLHPKYVERLEAWVPLNGDPHWFPCTDGSFTPWRYANAQPGEDEDWVDMSHCPLFAQVERDLADEMGDAYITDSDDDPEPGVSVDDEDKGSFDHKVESAGVAVGTSAHGGSAMHCDAAAKPPNEHNTEDFVRDCHVEGIFPVDDDDDSGLAAVRSDAAGDTDSSLGGIAGYRWVTGPVMGDQEDVVEVDSPSCDEHASVEAAA